MTSTATPPAAMLVRLVLTPKQRACRLAEHIVLVATGNATGDPEGDIPISVYGPGLDEAALREQLCQGLALTTANLEWVNGVVLEDDAVVVQIDPQDPQRDHTIDLVLDMVPAILERLDIADGRPAYAVRGGQCLVLVDYREPDRYQLRRELEFFFPDEITITRDPADRDPADRYPPERYLRSALQLYAAVTNVWTTNLEGMRLVTLSLKPEVVVSLSEYSRLVNDVIAAFASRARLDGPYKWPVFRPARIHTPAHHATGPEPPPEQ